MHELYRTIMDSNINPLKSLPPVQRFQVMLYLSVMWTIVFCAGAGAWVLFGELIVAHVLFALGIFLTGLTFHRAKTLRAPRASRVVTYRDHPRQDGTARYDDVWGA